MALLYHRATVRQETKDITIYPLDDGDYRIAINLTDEEDEHAVTELLLTESEVKEAYDLLFNR